MSDLNLFPPLSSLNYSKNWNVPLEKAPRPPNSYMLFRQWHAQTARLQRSDSPSSLAGELWGRQPVSVKMYWAGLAQEVERKHRERYPGYKYTPRASTKQKRDENTRPYPTPSGSGPSKAEPKRQQEHNAASVVENPQEFVGGILSDAQQPNAGPSSTVRKALTAVVYQPSGTWASQPAPSWYPMPQPSSSALGLPSLSPPLPPPPPPPTSASTLQSLLAASILGSQGILNGYTGTTPQSTYLPTYGPSVPVFDVSQPHEEDLQLPITASIVENPQEFVGGILSDVQQPNGGPSSTVRTALTEVVHPPSSIWAFQPAPPWYAMPQPSSSASELPSLSSPLPPPPPPPTPASTLQSLLPVTTIPGSEVILNGYTGTTPRSTYVPTYGLSVPVFDVSQYEEDLPPSTASVVENPQEPSVGGILGDTQQPNGGPSPTVRTALTEVVHPPSSTGTSQPTPLRYPIPWHPMPHRSGLASGVPSFPPPPRPRAPSSTRVSQPSPLRHPMPQPPGLASGLPSFPPPPPPPASPSGFPPATTGMDLEEILHALDNTARSTRSPAHALPIPGADVSRHEELAAPEPVSTSDEMNYNSEPQNKTAQDQEEWNDWDEWINFDN